MCGIAGIVSFDGSPVHRDEVAVMCAAMRHRGPDDQGIHVDGGCALGMRRLSIIDLRTGHQPIANEDGSIWAVLNGEIYNYRELRQELVRRGHTLSTSSDTEVLVHLYEDHGAACVDRLRGMFAFAIWDGRARRLLLARDRLGIKPLYYGWVGRRLVFASELKALLELPGLERRLDLSALNHVLTFLHTPRDRSILLGVRKLEPAHVLWVSPGERLHIERYWNVRFEPTPPARAPELLEELRELLDQAVRVHMVSDVPVGAFLSGGVDSSSVVALMARASSRPIKTFSVGFLEKDYSELDYARLVARAYGTDHHEIVLEPDVLPSLEDLIWHLDEPFGDSSAIPTYVVSKLAGREVKVVLTGDGGDELFGGYDRYTVERRERRLDWMPAPMRALLGHAGDALPAHARGRAFLRHRALAGAERYLAAQTLFSLEERLDLFCPDARPADLDEPHQEAAALLDDGPGERHWLSRLQDLDLHSYLPLDILTKVDRMSMAHSLETRVPLLDHPLVELAARIPPDLQVHGPTTKYLFKRALQGIVPDTILARPKQGFAVPLGRWFRGKLRELARDVLLDARGRQRGIFDPRQVEALLDAPARGRDLDLQTWTLLSFELWCRLFLDQQGGYRPRRTTLAGVGP
jgi:asparagine synthase (glutamine-hydrolysing)